MQVTKGEEVPFNHEVHMSAIPADEKQVALTWRLYCSDQIAPTTVTGEHRLGKLVVACPPDPVKANRRQKAVFYFGCNEMKVIIVNAKGEEVRGEISMT
jgi:hypothetical protein